jgi:hypothetical protein
MGEKQARSFTKIPKDVLDHFTASIDSMDGLATIISLSRRGIGALTVMP